eukprot:4173507-Pyramimonas_sp.AAC.1
MYSQAHNSQPTGKPKISLEQLLAGDVSCIDLEGCDDFFGLADIYEFTDTDRNEAAARKDKLRQG